MTQLRLNKFILAFNMYQLSTQCYYLQIWPYQLKGFSHSDLIYKRSHGNHKVHHCQPERQRKSDK